MPGLKLVDVERALAERLRGELPRDEAHVRLAPRPRQGWRPGLIPEDHRDAAALVLLYERDRSTRVLLTVRSDAMSSHAGQISLPGGTVEPGESFEEAALREAREEIGLDPGSVRVLGRLSPLSIPISRFALHPIVAVRAAPPEPLRLEPREVERVLEPRLGRFASGYPLRLETWDRGSWRGRVPFFDLGGGDLLWGATAMVLAELLALLGIRPDPWS